MENSKGRRLALIVMASLLTLCASRAVGQQTGTGANTFPTAQSEAAAKAAQQGQNAPAAAQPSAHDDRKAGQSKPSSAKDNPFPEAQSQAAAKADDGAEQTPEPSASSSGYSSSDASLPPAELGQGKLTSHPKLDSYTRDLTADGRVEDDLSAGDLYMKNGNYRGALWRYQDALQYDPQNDAALFGAAEATCKQNKTTDAMAMFKSYTKSNPQGKYALKAEKLLAHPNKCAHNF